MNKRGFRGVKVGEKKVEGRGFFWKIFQGSRGFEGGGDFVQKGT